MLRTEKVPQRCKSVLLSQAVTGGAKARELSRNCELWYLFDLGRQQDHRVCRCVLWRDVIIRTLESYCC